MRKTFTTILFLLSMGSCVLAQSNYSWIFNAGGNGDDQATATATDASGNIFITGYFTGTVSFGSTSLTSAGDKDLFLVKLNSSGVVQWATKGGGTAADQGVDVKCDASGNVYTIGWHEGTASFGSNSLNNTNGKYSFIVKWDNSGNILTALNLGGYIKSFDVDNSNNLYVAAVYSGTINVISSALTSHGLNDTYLSKINSSGAETWVKTIWSTAGNETPISVCLTTGDSLLVSGRFGSILNFDGTSSVGANNGGASSEDLFLAKYSSTGNFGWFKQFDGSMSTSDAPQSLVTDALGNIVIVGTFTTSINFYSNFFNSTGLSDLFVAKLTSDGASALWAKKVGGNGNDGAMAVGIDNNNSIYLNGLYTNALTFETTNLPAFSNGNIYLAKYSNLGAFQWVKYAGGTGEDQGLGLSVLADGSAILCGKYSNSAYFHGSNIASNGGSDLFVTKSASTYTPKLAIAFSANNTTIMATQQVTFSDQSVGSPNHWAWSFAGGTPDTSNVQNPVITYNTPGTYTVTLFASNSYGEEDQLIKTNYITVNPYVSTCNAVQFDGVNDYIDCGSRSSLRVNSNFTIEAWVNPTEEVGFPFSYLTKTATSANGYGFGYWNGKLRFIIQPTNLLISAIETMPGATIPLNEWSHIACSYDGMVAKIYVNGVLAESSTLASSTTAITWSTNPTAIFIGKCTNSDGSLFFKGGVDDVRIWKSVRTESEISANQNIKLNGNETNLAAYWKLDEGTGSTVADATANHYNGTLQNSPAWIEASHSCSGVGVNEVVGSIQDLSVFPNPSSGVITIKSKDKNAANATVFDYTGQEILTFQLKSAIETTIDLSSISTGVYFIRINYSDNYKIVKFVKK